jgi:hypothetical protein
VSRFFQGNSEVWLNDAGSEEAIEISSPEGQLILGEAIRSLERRLSPDARSAMCSFPGPITLQASNRNRLCLKLYSLYRRTCFRAMRIALKRK